MGLDISHGTWSGTYSAFNRFREKIAEVSGYYQQWTSGQFEVDSEEDVDAIADGDWKKLPSDPILILLLHSDCDGEIKPDHCTLLANRMEALLPNIRGDGGGHVGSYKVKTEKFIIGLRKAAAANEPLEFQ